MIEGGTQICRGSESGRERPEMKARAEVRRSSHSVFEVWQERTRFSSVTFERKREHFNSVEFDFGD